MRDINIAGRDVNVDNNGEPERKQWSIALLVTVVGGVVVAFIAFKMGWI